MNRDESARQSASAILTAAVFDGMEDAELARSILAEAHGYVRDLRELKDGMPWPPEFVEHQIEAATELGIPYFQPSRVVRQYGVARATDGGSGPLSGSIPARVG